MKKRSLLSLLLALLLPGPGVTRAEEAEAGRPADDTGERMRVVRDDASGQLDILDNGQPVLRYNYRTVEPPEGYLEKIHAGARKYAVPRSNYIHPLYGIEGAKLTEDWSVDHPHHRGIYWAWPEVQYRDQRGDLHALQRVFARPSGKIEFCGGTELAQIDAENIWKWDDRTPIVRERAIIRARPADAQGRYVDLRFEFTALVEGVSLARRGTDKYGGLNIRLAPVRGLGLLHDADPPGAASRAAWQVATGTWEGAKSTGILAVFERVHNPDYPADYIQYPNLPWFQPTFPKAGSRYMLKEGQPLVLEYRLWIRAGSAPDPAQLREQWRIYNGSRPSGSPVSSSPSISISVTSASPERMIASGRGPALSRVPRNTPLPSLQ
jgi:hypothetical protein